MLPKAQISFIRSLQQKKYRDISRCFVAEGSKLVMEMVQSRFTILSVYALQDWFSMHPLPPSVSVIPVTPAEMERITGLATPAPVFAVVEIPGEKEDSPARFDDLTLLLDDIRDPGNLGTIIRIADWFGIRQVICSTGSVDCFNPKVVQATMGSITRVQVSYRDLPAFLSLLPHTVPVYGMMLSGPSLYESELTEHGLLVIGSEARGISVGVDRFITRRLSIPFHPAGRLDRAESLNAAVAAGIVCAEFRRMKEVKRKT